MPSDHVQSCPATDSHRRLMDCHAQWHHLHESYLDPDGFRLSLNSLLQNLRNVTFLLQKQKANLSGFATWYPAFQQAAGQNEIMKWSVRSRNRVTKESDLELLSDCKVTWTRNWVQRAEGISSFPPRMTTREIIKALRNYSAPPVGTITIRRRWVDKELPDWELLDATAEVFSQLSQLLRTVHTASGVDRCNLEDRSIECVTSALSSDPSRLPCMHFAQAELQGHFSLSEGSFLEPSFESIEIDRERGRASAARYGDLEFPSSDPIANVPGFMETARKIMNKDGHHGTFCFLYRGESVVSMQALEFDDQETKILSFERIADLVESTRADGVLFIGEMWLAMQTEKEKELQTIFFPARDRLDRMEGLTVYAVTRDGRQAERLCVVERGPNGEARCGEPIDVDFSGAANTILPVKRKWAEMKKRGL